MGMPLPPKEYLIGVENQKGLYGEFSEENLPTIALNTSGFAEGQVVFYPNPVEDRLTVRFNLEGEGVATIGLFDVLGNDTKFRKQCELSTVNNTCQLSLGSFRNGVYIAKISYTNQVTKDTKVGYFRVTVSH
jgi:hypothetical protein